MNDKIAECPGIAKVVAALGEVVSAAHWKEPSTPTWGVWPHGLPPALARALAEAGFESPYAHQAEALEALGQAADVALVTPTASGKSLVWMAHALCALVSDPRATALYVAPSKALARDQLEAFRALAAGVDASLAASCLAVDADSTPQERARARAGGRVLLTNPEMLHHVIVPAHPRWARFLGGLELIALDEAHAYRGILGAHLASLLWRVERVVAHHRPAGRRRGSYSLLAASATIANPEEHLGRLTGRSFHVVRGPDIRGGPQLRAAGEPRLLDASLGIRRTLREEAAAAVATLAEAGLRSLLFVRTRREAEETLLCLRSLTGQPDMGRLYRAGLEARQRRAVEEELRGGRQVVVVTTNALELGVDPGPVDACVIAGFPGTLAGFRQQGGRAGRRGQPSIVLFLAGPGPLDQYLLRRPELLWEGELEHARLDPGNRLVRLAHLRAGAYELPLRGLGDAMLRPGAAEAPETDLVRELLDQGELREESLPGRERQWRWMGRDSPARGVDLRAGDGDAVEIRLGVPPEHASSSDDGEADAGPRRRGRARLVGTEAVWEAGARLHPGAVLLVGGEAYRVTALDLPGRRAWVEKDPGSSRTAADEEIRLSLLEVGETSVFGQGRQGYGVVSLGRQVVGYREWNVDTGARIRKETLDLPPMERKAAAWWLELGPDLDALLADEGVRLTPGHHTQSRGPGWTRQRRRVRERDGHRCQGCGAPEPAGREHHVHHRRPFRLFGWEPGVNRRHELANRLENLVLLCPSCHQRAEASLHGVGLLQRLGSLLGHVAALVLMGDPRDLEPMVLTDLVAGTGRDTSLQVEWERQAEPGAPGERAADGDSAVLARLLLVERPAGGAGLSEALYHRRELMFDHARSWLQACPCAEGCPACAGPPDDDVPAPKVALRRLLGALEGSPPGTPSTAPSEAERQ